MQIASVSPCRCISPSLSLSLTLSYTLLWCDLWTSNSQSLIHTYFVTFPYQSGSLSLSPACFSIHLKPTYTLFPSVLVSCSCGHPPPNLVARTHTLAPKAVSPFYVPSFSLSLAHIFLKLDRKKEDRKKEREFEGNKKLYATKHFLTHLLFYLSFSHTNSDSLSLLL